MHASPPPLLQMVPIKTNAFFIANAYELICKTFLKTASYGGGGGEVGGRSEEIVLPFQ